MKRLVFKIFMMLLPAASVAAQEQDNLVRSLQIGVADTVLSMAVGDTVATRESVAADSLSLVASAQPDVAGATRRPRVSPYRFKPLQLAVPVTLLGVGLIGCESDWLKYQNKEIRDELQENIDSKFTIDDFSQYAPMAATYGLNLCGLKGKHGYGDLTIILGTAYALMGITVNSLKSTTRVLRPDGSSRNSFPSGHTATAFMGAELLRREYWDVSPWIGVAGYAVAAGTGFFRMYNNRHWLTDVVAGAGVGILSVEAAYWLYPVISKTFFRRRYLKNTFISPYLSNESKGVTCAITF